MRETKVAFSSQFKSVYFDFSGEKISSDGGVLLLDKVERKHRFLRDFSRVIPDYRSFLLVEHTIEKMVKQRTYLMALGYEDCDDSDLLRNDPIISKVLDKDLASQPTLSRFENSISKRTIFGLCDMFIKRYVNSIKPGQPEVIIDVDCTDDPTHGAQQLSLFNGHHGQFMYNELVFFDGVTGELILPVLRPGNVHTSRWMPKILSRIVKAIRTKFPRIEIIIRADAGFSNPNFFNLSEGSHLEFCMGLRGNQVLNRLIKDDYDEVKKQYADNNEPHQRFIGPFEYQAESWEKPQRVFAKVESTGLGMNVRFYVSSMGNYSAEGLYTKFYVRRGETCENRIKDIKNYCYSDRLSCSTFWANFFRLILACLAYELLRLVKVAISKTEYEQCHTWNLQSIRLHLLKVAGYVKERVKYCLIKLSSSFIHKELFHQVIQLC
jgi:Transposase DDE domain group 1